MKNLIYIAVFLFLVSCANKTNTLPENSNNINPKVDSALKDNSPLSFQYKIDISDANIVNKSDRQVDLLFNSMDNFLGEQNNIRVGFDTECMRCEPVQKFQDGLLFAKRLLLKPDKTIYYKKDFDIADTVNDIKMIHYGERKKMNFNFENAKGAIQYLGISCNDADYNKVQLEYKTGVVIIDSILNASLFEYDLDSNGQKEQYLLETRNCSQELVILRITNRSMQSAASLIAQ